MATCFRCGGTCDAHKLIEGVTLEASGAAPRSRGFVPCPLGEPGMQIEILTRENVQLTSQVTALQERATRDLETIRELTRAAETRGLLLPGWFCASCGVLNGSAKEQLLECRCCGKTAPA